MNGHTVELEIFLGIGDYYATTRSTRVMTVLGSCISVTMHHPMLGFGAICHASLPSAPPGQAFDYRYVDHVIPAMIGWFERHNIPRRELAVKLFGGGNMYGRPCGSDDLVTVGCQNAAMAKIVLREEGLELTASDVGGRDGRALVFHTSTGRVLVRKSTYHGRGLHKALI